MIEMVLKEQLILNLKSRFYDLIQMEGDLLTYDDFLKGMLFLLKSLLNLDEATFYKWNEDEEQLQMESTTSSEFDHSPLFISWDEAQDIVAHNSFVRKPISIGGFEQYDVLMVVKKTDTPIGIIVLKGPVTHLSDETLMCIAVESASFFMKFQSLCNVIFEEKRYKQLFRVTEKFHSSMDMDAVLGEIILTLQEVYPTFTYYLMLSHDNDNHGELPIKDLEYDTENISAMQAYLTGMIQLEDSLLEKKSILYAPLKGRQGVYGVLQVIAPNTMTFPKKEVEFIVLLANTAGSALENAQLYQQSRRLITDLQLINETTHRLNSDLRLTETINFMSTQILDSFNAEEVGFVLSHDLKNTKILPGSTSFFTTKESEIYIQYVKEKIKSEKDSLFLGDLSFEKSEMLYRSVMAVPMVQTGTIKGFVLVMHHEPYHFTFETFKLLQSLIHHSTLAFTNAMLRDELEKMVITDHLTKLYTRNYLDERINRSMKEDAFGTFILIDIDNFKQINDNYGHQVGDEVLLQVAEIIHQNIRDTDIGARWGGEELAIYLPKVTLPVAINIAERLVRKVEEGTNPQVTISCGVSHWSKDRNDTFTQLFKRADQALYEAKESGKNRMIVQHEED